MKPVITRIAVVLHLSALLTACQPALPLLPARTPPTPALPAQKAVNTSSPTPTPARMYGETASAPEAAVEQPTPTFTPPVINPDTLRFVFPTPGPRPISAWRPPLYPVPWAPGPHDHFLFARPIAADEVNWPIPDYRFGGIFPGSDNIIHTGIDIDAPAGTPILAAASGKVIWAGVGLSYLRDSKTDPYGIAVAIRHDFGYNGSRLQTIYAHMQEVDVVVGQAVQAGDRIGLVGDTGLTTGPHLHFEVRVEELNYFTTRNPELWLAPPQGWGILAGHFLTSLGNPIPAQPVRVISADEKYSWTVMTYGNSLYGIKSDPYYQENMVLSDLPAGKYKVLFDYQGAEYSREVEIHPGTVNLITFHGGDGFAPRPTATPDLQFLATPTRTPSPK